MNVEIGTEAPIILFWEYLFQIFGILSLQCNTQIVNLWIQNPDPWQNTDWAQAYSSQQQMLIREKHGT